MDAFQAACDGAVGQTLSQLSEALGTGPDRIVCSPMPPLSPLSSGVDTCPASNGVYAQTMCEFTWSSRTGDPGRCSEFGCWFGCDVRAVDPGTQDVSGAALCGRLFYSGQPCNYGNSGICG